MILKKPWLLGGWKPWQSDSHVGDSRRFGNVPWSAPGRPAVWGRGRRPDRRGNWPWPGLSLAVWRIASAEPTKMSKKVGATSPTCPTAHHFRTAWRIWKSWELGSGSPSTGLQLHGEVHQACWTGALSTGVTESKSQSHQVLKISRCKEVSWKFNEYLLSVTLK